MENHKKFNRNAVFAWCLYDFGNSAFTTLVVTFIYATFFSKAMAQNETDGTWYWSLGVTTSALLIALLSPVLGAMADRSGRRKLFLLISTLLCIGGSAMLYFPLPYETLQTQGLKDQVFQAMFWFVVANVSFEVGITFYNAFLPDLAPKDRIGRISGYGWGLGYVGGLLCMVVALVGFVQTETPWFGFSTTNAENIRATNLLVGVWQLLFCLPFFWLVPNPQTKGTGLSFTMVKEAFTQIKGTFARIKTYRQLARLLLANMFYNDALVTIFAMGAVYAATVFKFTTPEIIIFGIVLNVTAGLGAFLFGFVDDKLGGKRTIRYSIWGLIFATILAVVAPDRTTFWLGGVLVGIFSGPNQSATRSLIGRFVPADKETEFYGFFALSGRFTSWLGPFLFGLLTMQTDSIFRNWFGIEPMFEPQRAGVGVLLILFAIGMFLLNRVNEAEGIAASQASQNQPVA